MLTKQFCNHVGQAIRGRRCELGLTQKDLAGRLHVSPQQIQRYESGQDQLNVDSIQMMATALKATVPDLISHESLYNHAVQIPRLNRTERTLIMRFRRISDLAMKDILVQLIALAAETDITAMIEMFVPGQDKERHLENTT